MSEAWIQPELAFLVPVVGGSLLGLSALLRRTSGKNRSNWVGLLLVLLVAGFAAASAASGYPPALWQPPLALAGVSLLFAALRSPELAALASAILSRLRSTRLQGGLLLAGSLAIALAMAYGSEPPIDPPPDQGMFCEFPSLQPVHPGEATTDRGRPLELFTARADSISVPIMLEHEQRRLRDRGIAERVIRMAPADLGYNCHGWVFTGGHYFLIPRDVELILQDNGYRPVATPQVNDLAIYRNEQREIKHTGVVRVADENGLVLIESKWGCLGRFLHPPDAQPCGGECMFYRSRRAGHLLAAFAESTSTGVEPPDELPAEHTNHLDLGTN
jgi:hypothetical protein